MKILIIPCGAGNLWLSLLYNMLHSFENSLLISSDLKEEASLKLQLTLSHTHILGQRSHGKLLDCTTLDWGVGVDDRMH